MKFSVLLSLLVFAVAGLTTTRGREAAPKVVPHVADVKKSETSLRFSEELRILLPAPPHAAAGCEWQIASNDPRILRLSAAPKPATPAELAGAEKPDTLGLAGAWSTTFFALRPGRSVVRLVYVLPSKTGESTALVTREIVVTVNGGSSG